MNRIRKKEIKQKFKDHFADVGKTIKIFKNKKIEPKVYEYGFLKK